MKTVLYWLRLWLAGAMLVSATASAHGASLIVQLTDRDGKPLPDGVVLLYAMSPGNVPGVVAPTGANTANSTAASNISLSQQDLQFERYVTVVRVGTEISFPNRDKLEHHIKSFGPAQTFEMKVYAPGENRKITFTQPGPSAIVCYLHSWMRAWVYATDANYYVLSNNNGFAQLDNVPEGTYEIRIWHPDTLTQPKPQAVQIKNSNSLVSIATQAVPRKRPIPKTN